MAPPRMRVQHLLSVSLVAVAAAGLSVLAHRYDQLWLAVVGLSAAFAGGGALLHVRGSTLFREIDVLREHLESTRQHAALLARHTRELREAFVNGPAEGAVHAGEFATLSALVRDIADGVAELDRRTEATEQEIAYSRRPASTSVSRAAEPRPSPGWLAPQKPAMPEPARASALMPEERVMREAPTAPRQSGNPQEPPRAVRQLVAAAIAADRFDLFLQRVVGLPQRRLKGYDVTLRPDGSDLTIPNAEIRLAVEAVGHQLAFDRKLMIQAVRLARVFSQRERDVLLFVDISQRFLMSEAAFDDLEALIADVPQAPERIVLCLPQRFFRKAVAFEHEALRNLGKMGFSFMMRDIEDLDFDPVKLAQMGVRWLRMPAEALLSETHERDTLFDVATADFVPLLARRKLSFMVDAVSDEPTIADLIDLNIEYAQGLAFSPPQAVRADVLEAGTPAPEPPRPTEPPVERRSLRDLARRA